VSPVYVLNLIVSAKIVNRFKLHSFICSLLDKCLVRPVEILYFQIAITNATARSKSCVYNEVNQRAKDVNRP
jgi:hypothetical protein